MTGAVRIQVTTIVPTFNRARMLGESLRSLLAQTRRPDRIVVVNDGSTDDTLDVLARLGDDIEVISKANGGKSSALNAVLPEHREGLVWMFDDDDVAMPDALQRHLDIFARHPGIDFTYSGFVPFQETAAGVRRDVEPVDVPDLDPGELFYRLLDRPYLPQQGIVVTGNAIAAIGGFDPQLIRSQDYDFALRLARRFRGRKVPGPTFHFRQHVAQRGGRLDCHEATDKSNVWLRYDQMIFSRLMASMSLAEFLPQRGLLEADLSAAQRRHALLHRMSVASTRAMFDRVMDDLEAAIAIGGGPLSPLERECCYMAFHRDAAVLAALATRGLFEQFRASCGGRLGRAIRFHAAHGLMRSARLFRSDGANGAALACMRRAADLLTPIDLAILGAYIAKRYATGEAYLMNRMLGTALRLAA